MKTYVTLHCPIVILQPSLYHKFLFIILGKSGKFWRDLIEDRSSIESYDRDLQRDVWKLSRKLCNIRTPHAMDNDDDFDDISLGTGPSDRLLTNPVA